MKSVTRGGVQDLIAEKATQNAAYREALLADPKKVLESHLGDRLPDWLNVEVVEEKAEKVFLVAPHVPAEELDDADLEMVAGGKGGGGGNETGAISCTDNAGAFNSVITINTEVSLV